MPARIRKIRHDDNTRAKIQAAKIIRHLHEHVFGERELTATQIKAADLLLSKSLPSLQSVEHSGEVKKTYVIRTPAPVAGMDAWKQQYASQPTTIQ